MASNGSDNGVSSKQPIVCVFCGSSPGTSPAHLNSARELAKAFHKHGIQLVYGGGTVGLMGELARTLVSLSGPSSVHGIIPAALVEHEQKVNRSNVIDLSSTIDSSVYGRTTVVADMHARKAMMAQEVNAGGPGSGFVALAGGYGTFEELMEVTTWNQLGIHGRGVVVFNVEGYWDGLMQWVDKAVEAGFVAQGNRKILVQSKTAEGVLDALRDYQNTKGRLNLAWNKT